MSYFNLHRSCIRASCRSISITNTISNCIGTYRSISFHLHLTCCSIYLHISIRGYLRNCDITYSSSITIKLIIGQYIVRSTTIIFHYLITTACLHRSGCIVIIFSYNEANLCCLLSLIIEAILSSKNYCYLSCPTKISWF